MKEIKEKGGILLFEAWHGKQHIGSSRIRGHWLVSNWDKVEPQDSLLELFQQGAKYSFCIFQKCYWEHYLEVFDGIKILDCCDPDWLDGVPIKEIVDKCDAVTTSTETIAEEIRKFTETPVRCIPDRQDLQFHNIQKKHTGRAKKVIWFGYSHNAKTLDITLGFLKKYNLKLTVLSSFRPPYNPAHKNIKYDWGNPSFDFNEIILRHDIVIMPERNDPRGRFKSLNKTHTAWALGMPVATTPDELKRFLDPEERQKEADERLKEIREKWNIKISVREFKQFINELKEKKR